MILWCAKVETEKWLADLFLFKSFWVDTSAILNKNFRDFLHSLLINVRITANSRQFCYYYFFLFKLCC